MRPFHTPQCIRLMATCLAVALFLPSPVHAAIANQCAFHAQAGDNQVECAGTGNSNALVDADVSSGLAYAVRSNPGLAPSPIDIYNVCRYIDNVSANNHSVFIPLKSSNEWNKFVTAVQTGGSAVAADLSATTCARPASVSIPPSTACAFAAPASFTENLPYARTNATLTKTYAFTCTVKGLCGADGCGADKTWTQTATAVYTAGNPTWATAITYSGTPPTASPSPVNGVCSTTLYGCTAGTSGNNATVNGTATWSCAGLDGGTNAACLQSVITYSWSSWSTCAGNCGQAGTQTRTCIGSNGQTYPAALCGGGATSQSCTPACPAISQGEGRHCNPGGAWGWLDPYTFCPAGKVRVTSSCPSGSTSVNGGAGCYTQNAAYPGNCPGANPADQCCFSMCRDAAVNEVSYHWGACSMQENFNNYGNGAHWGPFYHCDFSSARACIGSDGNTYSPDHCGAMDLAAINHMNSTCTAAETTCACQDGSTATGFSCPHPPTDPTAPVFIN